MKTSIAASLSRWFSAQRTSSRRYPSGQLARFRPSVEPLEDRDLLSTITVTNAGDEPNKKGTLRSAIELASPGDTIQFTPGVMQRGILLTQGQLLLDKDLTIEHKPVPPNGPLANQPVEISGGSASRVLEISSGAHVVLNKLSIRDGAHVVGGNIFNRGKLTLLDSEIVNGSAASGGGVYNDWDGTLHVVHSTFLVNTASIGGGILNRGTLVVTGSSFLDNSAGSGGAIANREASSQPTATITDSVLTGNQSGSGGGGIDNGGGILEIVHSVFANNQANSGVAVSSYSVDFGSELTVVDTMFTNNSAGFLGGAIASSAPAMISGSVITGGHATQGGGIFNNAYLEITNSVVSDNSATESGGGIANFGTLYVTLSTISGNSSGSLGGGITNHRTLHVTSSTVSGNEAVLGGGVYNEGINGDFAFATITDSDVCHNVAIGTGGGAYNSSILEITHSRVTGNEASYEAGGIFNNGGILVVLDESYVTGNDAPDFPNVLNTGGLFWDGTGILDF